MNIILFLARPVASKFQRRRKQLSIERTLSVLGKTNPKRTQTNPIFWRSKPILSLKTQIFDKFRITFLCKTNPIYKNFALSMRLQKTLIMQNEPNGMLFKTNSNLRTLILKKNTAILTISYLMLTISNKLDNMTPQNKY